MKEELFENPVELRTAVSPPHFEDRRVVQRAQRVVPLDVIRMKLRNRRLWFLSGALAIAMMLGAASALVAVRVKRIAANNEIPQVEEQQSAEAQPSIEVAPVTDSTVAETTPVQKHTSAKRQDTLVAKPWIVDTPPETVNGRQPSEDEQLRQIREAVLYEKWQERRARRVSRRERRNRDDRDLSRVDEIFEGRRRPERP